jgi:hypothetical protein
MTQSDTSPGRALDDKLYLTPRRAAKALAAMLDFDMPVMFWGKPGIGKSQIVRQAVALHPGWGIRDIRAALHEPYDVYGIPFIVDGQCRQAPPSILPREGVDAAEGVLFLDELPHATPAVQGALLQLVLDRRVDTYRLPKGWRIVAAGNGREHHAGGYKMISALSRRFVNLNLISSIDDWQAWAIAHKVSPIVIAFLKWQPGLLDKDDLRQLAGPNPRAWVEAAGLIESGRLDKEIEREVLAGKLGQGAAGDLISFVQVFRELPDPNEIIARPKQALVPTGVSTLYAVCGALAPRVTEQNVGAIFTYSERLPEEYRMLLVTDCLRYNGDISLTPVFKEYISVHGDSMLIGD